MEKLRDRKLGHRTGEGSEKEIEVNHVVDNHSFAPKREKISSRIENVSEKISRFTHIHQSFCLWIKFTPPASVSARFEICMEIQHVEIKTHS